MEEHKVSPVKCAWLDGTDEEADIRFRDIYRSKMLSLAMSQYQFRQVRVAKASVDDSHGDCGNMLAAREEQQWSAFEVRTRELSF